MILKYLISLSAIVFPLQNKSEESQKLISGGPQLTSPTKTENELREALLREKVKSLRRMSGH
jgi:hypothetical protein